MDFKRKLEVLVFPLNNRKSFSWQSTRNGLVSEVYQMCFFLSHGNSRVEKLSEHHRLVMLEINYPQPV